jgi:7,8-dihydropterin-6-yl-methyl-4-(beta-D-ribofuranosyl)aminobenzene 5'-phosphate synthase
MTATVIVEDTCPGQRAGLRPEHGLSILLALDGATVLHDLGASGLFAENATALGVDLAAVDVAVLSHGHHDHGGGLPRFLEVNSRAPVFLRRAAGEPLYRRAFGRPRPIGIVGKIPDGHADRIRPVDGETEPVRGVTLITAIGRAHPWVKFNRLLLAEHGGRIVADPLDHELVMVVHRAGGMVVCTGCGHSGVLNMVDAARARFPGVPIKAVIGGFHLGGVPATGRLAESAASVRAVGEGLLARGVERTWTGHCTGTEAGRTLKTVMGSSLEFLTTGLRIEL